MSVTVALRACLTAEQVEGLRAWLADIADDVWTQTWMGLGKDEQLWGMLVADVALLGVDSAPSPTLHAFDVLLRREPTESDILDDPDEQAVRMRWKAQVGFYPEQVLELSSAGHHEIEHRLLGHLALRLAKRYDGIINLSGAWYPPMNLDWVPESDPANGWTKAGQQPFAYVGPGRVCEIQYVKGRGTNWYYNLADVKAFRTMLQQEAFYLIE